MEDQVSSQSIELSVGTALAANNLILVEVVQVMKNRPTTAGSNALFRQWWWKAVFAGSLLVAGPSAAANIPQASVNKLALKAYCSEAHQKAASLADGSIYYKQGQIWPAIRRLRIIRMSILIRQHGKPESLPSWINMETSL